MSKKLLAGLVLGLLVTALLVPTIFAAEESDGVLDSLYGQMHELRRQVVERRVELGQLTPEQGEQMQIRMENRYQRQLEDGSGNGVGFGERRYGGPDEGRGEWRGEGRGEGRGLRDGSCGKCDC